MVIHLSVLLVIVAVSLIYNRYTCYNKFKNKNYVMPIAPWLIIFGYLTFLAAMRTAINDTYAYVRVFKEAAGGLQEALEIWHGDGKDKGFYALGSLFKGYISQNYHMWFLFVATIESICFIKVFRKESYSILVTCYFFFATSIYYNYFSMMRQFLAVALIFAGFEWLKEKKWLPYIILCIIAAQFHSSAYFCILFFFLVQGEAWGKKQTIISVIAAGAVLFLNPVLNMMESGLQDTTYDYVIETMQSSTGSSPIRVVLAAIPVILAYVHYSMNRQAYDKSLNICVNMSLLNFLLTLVATFTSGLYVIRLTTYLAPYNAILYSYLIEASFKKQDERLVKVIFYVFYFMFFYYEMWHSGAGTYGSDIIGYFT